MTGKEVKGKGLVWTTGRYDNESKAAKQEHWRGGGGGRGGDNMGSHDV